MRFKKTEICQTCCKLKNVCQTCLLDLQYGLPTQVRDAALRIHNDLPQSDVNKEYYIQQIDKELKEGGDNTVAAGSVGKAIAADDMLSKLARTAPYYKRNRPHICSFWVRGECKRGEECPYRHDKPSEPDDPLSEQNIKDRYYGVNDPVADKILKRAAALPTLPTPEDKTITTLYVGNIGEHLTETDIKDNFYQFGEIRQITTVPRQQCAFVQYTKRSAAELAAEKTFNKLVLGGRRLTIKWAHSQAKQQASTTTVAKTSRQFSFDPVPGLPGALPMPPNPNDYFNLQASEMTVLPPGMKLHQLPPGLIPNAPFPPMYPPLPPYATPYNPQSVGMPTGIAPNPIGQPPMPPPPGGVHYPSQDPSRLGTIKK